jgi:hypothetical protein
VFDLDRQITPNYVSWDQDGVGAGMNHLRTLREMRQRWQTGWLVVLEDDCQPVPGLREQLDMALDAAPSPIVSLRNHSCRNAFHREVHHGPVRPR